MVKYMELYFTVGIRVPTLVIGCERYSVRKIAVPTVITGVLYHCIGTQVILTVVRTKISEGTLYKL